MDSIEPENQVGTENQVGVVTNYYTRIGVAVVELKNELTTGTTVKIAGGKASLMQKVESIEIHHKKVEKAGPGTPIGLKVDEPVRKGDKIYYIV